MKSKSVSDIVRIFVIKGKPNHALVALGMILSTTIILAVAAFLLLR